MTNDNSRREIILKEKANLSLCRRGIHTQRQIHKHCEVVVAVASIVDDFTVFSSD
jgi:hypothetical protein